MSCLVLQRSGRIFGSIKSTVNGDYCIYIYVVIFELYIVNVKMLLHCELTKFRRHDIYMALGYIWLAAREGV